MPRLEVTPSRWFALAAFIPVAVLASPARAETVDLQQAHRPSVGLELSLGVRGARMGGAGFEPFSSDHAMAESTLIASYRVMGSLRQGLTAGVEWNAASASSNARGSAASLEVERLAVSLRGNVSFRNHLIFFGRLAPGAMHTRATLQESSAVASNAPVDGVDSMAQTRWAPYVDGALGAGLRLGQIDGGGSKYVYRIWLVAEGGYSLTPSYQVTLASTAAAAPAQASAPLRLGEMSPGGPFMDFALALTF